MAGTLHYIINTRYGRPISPASWILFRRGESGDVEWRVTHRVVNGKVDGLVLTEAELTWLRACWMSTGELVRKRGRDEGAGPSKA